MEHFSRLLSWYLFWTMTHVWNSQAESGLQNCFWNNARVSVLQNTFPLAFLSSGVNYPKTYTLTKPWNSSNNKSWALLRAFYGSGAVLSKSHILGGCRRLEHTIIWTNEETGVQRNRWHSEETRRAKILTQILLTVVVLWIKLVLCQVTESQLWQGPGRQLKGVRFAGARQ